jgi:para-aminobenzoate synthetase
MTYVTSAAGEHRATEVRNELLALAADARNFIKHTTTLTPRNRAQSNFTRNEYMTAVLRIKEHIRAGDIYQANLTQQLTSPLSSDTDPADIFRRLRRAHPAAMSAFLQRREDAIVSCSPERFLRVCHEGDARRIEAAPIKGTRPRGRNAEEDSRLRYELATSGKDRAENIMIVDLLRNDLGRLCRYGSIEVSELCRVEEHPTLFHLVSTVQGTLRDDVTASRLLRAAFPCGSITGAPKIRAMEVINEIEPAPRGLSMGSIGYFSFCGAVDLNVAIRTMTIRDRMARFNVGGGITIDSRPADEYEESLIKARALFTALNAEFENPLVSVT